MTPLQVGETSQAVKDLASIENITVAGIMILVLFWMGYIIYYQNKRAIEKEKEEREDKKEMTEVLRELTTSISSKNSEIEQIHSKVTNTDATCTKMFLYMELKDKK